MQKSKRTTDNFKKFHQVMNETLKFIDDNSWVDGEWRWYSSTAVARGVGRRTQEVVHALHVLSNYEVIRRSTDLSTGQILYFSKTTEGTAANKFPIVNVTIEPNAIDRLPW